MKFYISVFLSVLSPRLWQEMWGFFWKLEGTRHQSPLRDCLIHTVGCPAVRWLCCRAKESGISLVSCSYPESLALPPSLPTSSPRELSDPSFQSSVKGCFLGCPPGSGVQIPALLLVPAFCSCVPWETTGGDSSIWIPAWSLPPPSLETQVEFLVPSFSLTQP